MRLPLLDRLDGPPPTLPRALDLASERFWRIGPRRRAVLGVLVVAALLVVAIGSSARSPWGAPVHVAVAARDLPAGHALSEGDLRVVRRPADLVPAAAADPDATGTLTGLLPRGAVLSDAHLGDGGHGALLAAGRAAVALPADLLAEHTPGAVLDLVASDAHGEPRVLAARARVLGADEEQLWVEVAGEDAAGVAAAAHHRGVAAVVHPP